MKIAEKIIVALDTQDEKKLNYYLSELKETASIVKIGMELFYSSGPQIIKTIQDAGLKVFLDLKIHDIPNTAKGASKALTIHGVDMFNIHAAGGIRMMLASMSGVNEALKENPSLKRPKVIAVTQLTSIDQNTLNSELGIPGNIDAAVLKYAQNTKTAGLDGVVCSPREIELIKESCGSEFNTVTPGIRPTWSNQDDQKRIMTPNDALKAGTDYMVIGRPITQAKSPKEAFLKIIEEINE